MISHPKQWCTPQLVKLLCQQDHAWHQAVTSDSPEYWQVHETLVDLFHHKVQHIQTQAWLTFCNSLSYNSDLTFVTCVILNELTNTPNPSSSNILYHPLTNKLLFHAQDQAEAFCIHFAKVSCQPHISREDCPSHNTLQQSVNDYIAKAASLNLPDDKLFTMAELKLAIKKLPSKKAPGEDGIFNRFLKHFDRPLQQEILMLSNLIWTTGKIPSSFTRSLICPIFKQGMKPSEECCSY